MSRILILTNPDDPHAFVVREGLRRKGVEALLWHTSDLPTRQTGSLWLAGDSAVWEVDGSELELKSLPEPFTTVWMRRPKAPVLPESLAEEDRGFAQRECNLFLRALQEEVGSGAFWVNPLASQRKTLLKPFQLRAAARAGLEVPPTLCSNNPRHIRSFLRRQTQGAIYKSFFAAAWPMERGTAVLFSSVVRETDLPDDEILRATPGIFQPIVPKAYELRVTAVGHRLFTAKLRSQEVPGATIDYRAVGEELPMEPYDLPEPIAGACHRIMDDLGIVFGCFDFIVTPEGRYVFLEVNEMGAFLWIEERLEMGLLDAFCELLMQGRVDYEWRRSPNMLRWADVIEEAERQCQIGAPPRLTIGP